MTDDPAPAWPDDPALFLDLDGTLLHFADDPQGVVVTARVRRLLGRLATATGGAIAFVSGRAMADLDRLLAPHRFPVAAVHGLERRDGSGRIVRAPVDERGFAALERSLQRFVAAHPGLLLEHKGLTLALHYRRRPELESAVIDAVDAAIAESAPELEAMRGNRVVEVKSAAQDKGSAILAFMHETPFAGRTPVFVGDDVTDEFGFRAVNELGGLSVKVDSGATAARYRLPDIDAVLSWLEELVARPV